MITKTYKANTNISINVVLPSKKNLHIAFVPLSNGSSVFTTDNEDIQKSVENHYKFGKLFKLHSVHGQSETVETAGKASKNGSSENFIPKVRTMVKTRLPTKPADRTKCRKKTQGITIRHLAKSK